MNCFRPSSVQHIYSHVHELANMLVGIHILLQLTLSIQKGIRQILDCA